MKKRKQNYLLVLLTLFISLFLSQTSSAQIWVLMTEDIPEDWNLGFDASTNENFHICSNTGKVYRSTDSGTTWGEAHFEPGIILQNIDFIDDNTGYVAGSNDKYLKTTDGGASWNSITVSPSGHFVDVHFVTESIGFLAGNGASGTQVWKTTDGTSWTIQSLEGEGAQDMQFISAEIGYISGNNIISKTDDQGVTWETIYTAPDGVNIYGVDFYNEDLGIGVGNNGQFIARTADGGETWTVIDPPASFDGIGLFDVDFESETSVYAVGDEFILHSNDGGLTWVSEDVDFIESGTFQNIDFTPDGRRFAHGSYLFSDTASCALEVSASAFELCEGEELILSASGTPFIEWDNDVENGISFIPPVGTTTYTVIGSDPEICETSETIDITVLPAPTPTITQSGSTLETSDIGLSYEWFLDGEAIPDSDSPTIIISEAGDYTVVITYDTGCERSSEVFVAGNASIDDNARSKQFSVYPNPTTGIVNIHFNEENQTNLKVEIRNELGQLILEVQQIEKTTTLDLSNYKSGIYYLTVYSQNELTVERLILM